MGRKDSILGRSLFAGVCLWAAFPPLNAWPLAVVSISIYLSLIYSPRPLARRDYFAIWIGASLCWLGLLQGIRLAFWPLYFGWIALSLYLATYTVAFVGLSRALVHRWKWPLALAAPLAWISVELARGYTLTGFSACLLGHVVAKYPLFIQVAAHLGAYGVSGALVLLAVVVYFVCDIDGWSSELNRADRLPSKPARYRRHARELLSATGVVIAILGYSVWEVKRSNEIFRDRPPLFKAALIQENSPILFDRDADRNRNRNRILFDWESYLQQTRTALESTTEIDLVVWPESTFTRTAPVFDWDGARTLPPSVLEEGIDHERLKEMVASFNEDLKQKIARVYGVIHASKGDPAKRPYLMVGSDLVRIHGTNYDPFNAALWVTPDKQMSSYYAKQHLVMFGEYIPFAGFFPSIVRQFGLPRLSSGDQAVAFEIKEKALIAPSICFENVLPHVIQRQIRDLKRLKKWPDVLINITNDGWFRGSSISDHHLANATLASVENRRPMLVAANTGLSAWIDAGGKQIAVAPRRQGSFIIAQPRRDGRWGLWQEIGDSPIRLAAVVCFLFWLWPWVPYAGKYLSGRGQ